MPRSDVTATCPHWPQTPVPTTAAVAAAARPLAKRRRWRAEGRVGRAGPVGPEPELQRGWYWAEPRGAAAGKEVRVTAARQPTRGGPSGPASYCRELTDVSGADRNVTAAPEKCLLVEV